MKRLASVVLASLLIARAGATTIIRGGGGGSGGGGGGAHVRSVGTVGGAHAAAAPSSHVMNTTVIRNPGASGGISSHAGIERAPGRTWYHHDGGHGYYHYYSHDHYNWYGFWFGPSFYWFPYYYGYWWWYDPGYARWNYWYNGYWWYYPPGGPTYIYVNNGYVPYDQYAQTGETSVPAPPSTPPSAPPASAAKNAPSAPAGGSWKTPDGKRMVQINGPDGGAFLFDQTKTPPSLIKHLGDHAEKVLFAGSAKGPSKILVEFSDGSFKVFDESGNPAP